MNGENQEAQSGLRIIGVGIAIGLVLFMGSVGYAKWHKYPTQHLEPLLFVLNYGPYIAVAIMLLLGGLKFGLERLNSRRNSNEYTHKMRQIERSIILILGIGLGTVIGRFAADLHLFHIF